MKPNGLVQKNKKMKIHKKFFMDNINSIKHFNDWMFFDNDLINIEIAKPTLTNIEMMKNFGLDYVVKGFTGPMEYQMFDHIRIKHGIASMMYITRCVSNSFIASTLEGFLNDGVLPQKSFIDKEIDSHRLTDMNDNNAVRKMKERKIWNKRFQHYSVMLKKMIYKLILKKRVHVLEVII